MSGHHHAHAHHHRHVRAGNEKAVGLAACLTAGFMVVEAAGGLLAGSLALLADAGHMLADSAALILAWLAFRLARRPADWTRSYGFDRFSVLAAFVNGLALFVIAGWICVEAARRLFEPVEVVGGVMMWVALAGLAVNLLAFWILSRGERDNLNIRGALLHVLGDLLGSVGALAASLVIISSGWTPIDPILSVLVAAIILRSAWMVVRESGHILLQGTPRGLEKDTLKAAIKTAVPGVAEVDHVHAWSVTQERPIATLDVTIAPGSDPCEVKAAVKSVLRDQFGIGHATVEIETPSGG